MQKSVKSPHPTPSSPQPHASKWLMCNMSGPCNFKIRGMNLGGPLCDNPIPIKAPASPPVTLPCSLDVTCPFTAQEQGLPVITLRHPFPHKTH